jgi:hypothetical protein
VNKRLVNSHKANRIKNAIIKANRAIASVKAKPKIASLNSSSLKKGFLEVATSKDPKTVVFSTN